MEFAGGNQDKVSLIVRKLPLKFASFHVYRKPIVGQAKKLLCNCFSLCPIYSNFNTTNSPLLGGI